MAPEDREELTDEELEEASGGWSFFRRPAQKRRKACSHYMAARFSFFPGCSSCVYNKGGRCSHTTMTGKM